MARRRRPPRPGAMADLPPLKILGQIALLQVIYDVAAFALILFTALVAGKPFTLAMVLDWRALRGDTTTGWMLGFVWMVDAFIGFVLPLIALRSVFLVLHLYISSGSMANTISSPKQGPCSSPPHLALKINPRFCPDDTLSTPPDRIPVVEFAPDQSALVGLADR